MSGLLAPLGVSRGDVVALVGAGGKTTLAFRLASEARDQGWRVLVTTTTHMGTPSARLAGRLLTEPEGACDPVLDEALARERCVTLLRRGARPDKFDGVPPERVDELSSRADLLLVEADGARGRSLKVPAEHEPVVPRSTTLLLVVAALDALRRPLAEASVHRLERVAEVTGRAIGETVDETTMASALRWADGYLSRAPASARKGVFLNKAENAAARSAAVRLAARLVPPFSFVVAGSARSGAGRLL